MNGERHTRRKQLFLAALDRPPHERDGFLQQSCGGDASLLREVQELLDADRDPDRFPTTGPIAGPLIEPATAPAQLGPFRVLRLLGQGGMGMVYEAEQERPRRRVALKVLHPGLLTTRALRRFELEGDVLGRLEHPGIARIYEAGSSETGRGPQPWLAMELVTGEALHDHCARLRLPLDDRLRLLARVCDAIHHAHQRGIVHRDLKPQNVLVDASGQPKVLDFGIARTHDAELQPATLLTNPGMVVGTLQYMSPEQASGDPDAPDVRTDVYSLGVMLYELVAGRPPIDVAKLPMHLALQRVIEAEPPSLRTTTARVPGDVAVIAHKALAKDKDSRYGSAAELAADLRRYLAQEPIHAVPPSAWYRLRRFAARNRALVLGLAAMFATLLGSLVVVLSQRDTAREALVRVEAINRFLLDDVLAAPSPERLGRDARIADVLAPAARSAERTFASQPLTAAEILNAVGASYRALGMAREAEPVTKRALDLIGERSSDRLALRAQRNRVQVLIDLGQYANARDLATAAVATGTAAHGVSDPDVLDLQVSLALACLSGTETEGGIELLRRAAAAQTAALGAEEPRTLATRAQLAIALAEHGRLPEGTTLLEQTLSQQERALGSFHPATMTSRHLLGWILTLAGDWRRAEVMFGELLPVLESVYGADTPHAAMVRMEWVLCLVHLQRSDEAEAPARAALAALERRLGPHHRTTLKAWRILAEVLFRKGKHTEAIAVAARVVETTRDAGPEFGEDVGHALINLGRCQQEAGDQDKAAATFGEAVDVFRAASDRPTDYLAQALYNRGVALRGAGQPESAIAPLQEAVAIDVATWGEHSRNVIADRRNLAHALLDAGRAPAAIEQLHAALQAATAVALEPERRFGLQSLLGCALLAAGSVEQAEPVLRAAADGLQQLGREGSNDARRARHCLVQALEVTGRTTEADRYRDPPAQGR